MSSQESSASGTDVLTLLTEAAQWSEDETLRRLSTTCAAVKNFMKKSPDTSNGIQVARFAVGSFLPHVALEDAPDELLQALLPQLNCFVDDLYSQCKGLAKDQVQEAQECLNEVLLVVETVELVMQYCMQSESIQVEKLPSLPQTVLHVVNTSLTHCQDSSKIYGDQLEAVNEVLSSLFRQTVELCSQLTNFISKLSFDVFLDDDLDILAQVCQELCVTASCLSQLSEVRSSVIIWKVYTNLITTHHAHINTRLDLSPPLTALITEVTDGLNLLTQIKPEEGKLSNQDEKVIQRIMKISYFCIKIIMVLCDKFRGYLPGAHQGLLDLLLYLHRFTSYNIHLLPFPTSVKQTMDRQITIAIDPIISHLINDEDFIKMVLKSNPVQNASASESDNKDGSSYLLLLVSLLNPLSSANTCEQYGIQLLTSLMHNLQEAAVQLGLPCMVDGVMYGGRPQSKVTLYEQILCHVCAFAARLPAQQFKDLEALLFNTLLSGTSWDGLLASDVCCFVARYGSSELCHGHVSVLVEILAATVPLTTRSRAVSQLITRLVPLMATEDRYATCEKIAKTQSDEVSFPVICSILAASFPEQGIRQQLEKLLLSSVTKILGHVKSRDVTDRDVTEKQVKHLIVSLCSLSQLVTCTNFLDSTDQGVLAEFTYALANLWEWFPHEFLGCSLVDLLLSSLITITSVCLIHFDEQQLEQILCICSYGVNHSSASVEPAVCRLIAALGRRLVLDSQKVQNLLDILIECLVGCLRSEHPLTYQCALDAFITFGQHTKHEEVLPSCLEQCGEELEGRITQYLQQQPHNLSSDISSTHLLQQQQLDNIKSYHQIIAIDLKQINFMLENKETKQILEGDSELPSSDRCNKRRRSKDDNEMNTKLESFLSCLYKTQESMKEYKASGEMVQEGEKVRISNILKELQVQWNS